MATTEAVAQAAAAAPEAADVQSGTVQNTLKLGKVQHQVPGNTVPASGTNTTGGNTTNRSQHGHQNDSGFCNIGNK